MVYWLHVYFGMLKVSWLCPDVAGCSIGGAGGFEIRIRWHCGKRGLFIYYEDMLAVCGAGFELPDTQVTSRLNGPVIRQLIVC